MKRVDIISKVVGRDGQGKPVGGGISIPMGSYALKSDFESLKSMFNDFLEGDDTDSVINRWKDLEAFLDGISEDNTLDSILKAYVTLSGTQTIIGEKNFTGGLKVNGSPIYYDTEKKYWKLEGDLLVTGGVTMYGNEGTFTPSTIMDAIAVDGTTISKEGGILKVIGDLSGGATTLGSLINVGSWADSVASQDRIMYQAANSSQWVAKNLSDLAVGGVTGNYLPLSGGVLTSSANKILELNTTGQVEVGMRFSMSSVAKGWVGYEPSDGTILYNNASKASLGIKDDGTIHFNNNTIWHSGNDGSGSGLDADLLDGLDSAAFFCDKGASNSFDDKIYNGAYRTSSFKPNDAYGYGLVASFRSMETCAQIYFPDRNGEPQFRMQWNSQPSITSGWTALITSSSIGNYNAGSATKLQTARTIWGQSFDGTGNVDGDLTANGNITMRTGTAFDASKYLTLTNNASQYGRIGIHFNGSTQDGNDQWGDGGRSIITFRRKYGTATSYTYSYAIQHNLVDNTLGILYGSNVGILLNSAGNVGIGTTTPAYKLDIVGHCRSEFMYFFNKNWNGNAGYIGRGSSGNNRIILYAASDDVYIYSKGVVSTIFTGANMLVQGGVTMYSARKLKTIQDERGLSLEELSVIKPTRFTWKDGRDDKVHIGGIADDVMKVLPEVIYKTEDDTLTMDYGNAAFAIAASLIKPVVSHEERIRLLEEENKRLKEEVEQLKWNIA